MDNDGKHFFVQTGVKIWDNLPQNSDETEHGNEIENLVNWCGNNNLSLNVNKTKEIVSTSGSVVENMPLSTSMGMK